MMKIDNSQIIFRALDFREKDKLRKKTCFAKYVSEKILSYFVLIAYKPARDVITGPKE